MFELIVLIIGSQVMTALVLTFLHLSIKREIDSKKAEVKRIQRVILAVQKQSKKKKGKKV